jgi:hypothetical protein
MTSDDRRVTEELGSVEVAITKMTNLDTKLAGAPLFWLFILKGTGFLVHSLGRPVMWEETRCIKRLLLRSNYSRDRVIMLPHVLSLTRIFTLAMTEQLARGRNSCSISRLHMMANEPEISRSSIGSLAQIHERQYNTPWNRFLSHANSSHS